VPPSDVLVHGRGGLGDVLEVLRDVEDTLHREAASAAQTSRKFDSANEFKGLVERVRKGEATVVLRKLFLCSSGQCSVMQEIWIRDKRNPDARSTGNPFKSYAVVHVHHHWPTRVARSEDIKPAHLAIADAVNARHICDSGRRYQGDDSFFNTYIEPSGAGTLKVFPHLQEWPCPKCGLKNLQNWPKCRGLGAPCAAKRPCTAWKWEADSARDADLALILAEADKTLQWPSGLVKSEHRGAGDTYPQVHADRLDSLMSEYTAHGIPVATSHLQRSRIQIRIAATSASARRALTTASLGTILILLCCVLDWACTSTSLAFRMRWVTLASFASTRMLRRDAGPSCWNMCMKHH